MKTQSILIRMIALGAMLCASAGAQEPATVTVRGTASMTAQPKQVRVTVPLSGSGKDAKEAVADLRKTIEQVKGKLEALKPVEGTLKTTDATLGSGTQLTGYQRRQYQMIRQMQAKQNKGAETAPSVSVSSVLTATFDLPDAKGDDALVAAHALQQRIADAVKVEGKKRTPEEQELLEEMQGMGFDGAESAETSFQYVLVLTPEQSEGLLKQAIGDAASKAQVLATAAGKKLGDLHTLAARTDANPMLEAMQENYMMQGLQGTAPTSQAEATGTAPGLVHYDVDVTAVYRLQ